MQIATVISLIALGLSALSTFLAFFYQRTGLTGAVVRAHATTRRSGGFDGETANVQFQQDARIEVLLSNTGTRPLVITAIEAVVGAPNASRPGDEPPIQPYEQVASVLLEPKTALVFPIEFRLCTVGLDNVTRTTDIPERRERVWARVTVYDHRGRVHQPDLPAFAAKTTYRPGEENDRYPQSDLAIDQVHRPMRLV